MRPSLLVPVLTLALLAPAAAQRGGRTPAAPPRETPRAPAGSPAGSQTPAPGDRGVGRTPALQEGIRAPEGKLRVWFGAMDLDGNGWLSLREVAAGLGFDRGRFRVFDIDHDGRFDFDEYKSFYVREVAAGYTPAEPRTTLGARKETQRRDPTQLRVAFDHDLDGALDLREFAALLTEYGQKGVDARAAFQNADSNGDQRLDVKELGRVASFLDPIVQSASGAAQPMARDLAALFGARVERGTAALPPLIEGPVPLFWRLDLDGDGYIEDEDLGVLQGTTHLPISVRAVRSALDRDGDGKLSALELAQALDAKVRPDRAEITRSGAR